MTTETPKIAATWAQTIQQPNSSWQRFKIVANLITMLISHNNGSMRGYLIEMNRASVAAACELDIASSTQRKLRLAFGHAFKQTCYN